MPSVSALVRLAPVRPIGPLQLPRRAGDAASLPVRTLVCVGLVAGCLVLAWAAAVTPTPAEAFWPGLFGPR